MPEDSSQSTPSRWKMLEDTLLNSCRVWDLRARRYRHPKTGDEGEFYYINSRDWVVVVALPEEGGIVLVRQFRWGADALSWELPGGIIDEGEDPVEAGLRELHEETGYLAASGRLLGQCLPNPAILNNRCHLVLAEGCRLSEKGTQWDEHEEMEVRVLEEEEIFNWVKAGRIHHSLALTGLFYYKLEQERG